MDANLFSRGLSYDDVLLTPQYSDIESRSEIQLAVDMGKTLQLGLPIFSSPMDTISEDAMAVAMDSMGASAIIHRYNTIEEQGDIILSLIHI